MNALHNSGRTWPVIHVQSAEQAVFNAATCMKAGVSQVMLIQMEGQDNLVDEAGWLIQEIIPSMNIGVNYLSLPPLEALRRSLEGGWKATWLDQGGVSSQGVSKEAHQMSQECPSEHLIFVGVAFKYQIHEPDPVRAAVRAAELGWIPTTSGPATGQAPDLAKIQDMRHPAGVLAVASGLTPDNISTYGPWIDHALVATGIGSDFYTIDPHKLSQFVANYPPLHQPKPDMKKFACNPQ